MPDNRAVKRLKGNVSLNPFFIFFFFLIESIYESIYNHLHTHVSVGVCLNVTCNFTMRTNKAYLYMHVHICTNTRTGKNKCNNRE